jgi:hypothetical protein
MCKNSALWGRTKNPSVFLSWAVFGGRGIPSTLVQVGWYPHLFHIRNTNVHTLYIIQSYLQQSDQDWTKSFPETQLRRSKINLHESANRLSPVEPDRPKFAFLRRSFRREFLQKKKNAETTAEEGLNAPENLERMDKISLSSALDSPIANRRTPLMQVRSKFSIKMIGCKV